MTTSTASPKLESYSQLSKLVKGFDALDCTIAGRANHRKDLKRRLRSQQKALVKALEKGWDTCSYVDGIEKIEKCITALSA